MNNFGMCSEWYLSKGHCVGNYNKFCTVLRKGDIIQIKLPDRPYRWAICTQNGLYTEVAHRFDDPSNYKSKELQKFAMGTVQKVALDTLAEGGRVRNNNYRDRVTEPKPIPDIVGRVLEVLSGNADYRFGPYCPRTNNDANFVEVARYGRNVLNGRLGNDGRSQWYEMEDKEAFFWLLKKGDMVEFKKNGNSQYAVCISEPHVQWRSKVLILRYGLRDVGRTSKTPIDGTIEFSAFNKVARKFQFRIDNSEDDQFAPKNPDDICNTASNQIDQNCMGNFHITKNNSWHFAMWLRYGINLGGLDGPSDGPPVGPSDGPSEISSKTEDTSPLALEVQASEGSG